MMKLFGGVLLGFFLGTISLAIAQPAILLHISQVMTASQFVETGVSALSESQRNALDNWLNGYTRSVLKVGSASVSGSIYSGEGKHWVDEVCKDGAIVVLEDNSIWQIESSDQSNTSLWLSTTNVTVRKSSKASGEYLYLLRNTEDKETAHAKYLGEL